MNEFQREKKSKVPGAGDLLNPLLRAMHSLGGTASIEDIEKIVIDNEGISDGQLSVLVQTRPKSVFSKNLGNARTYLREIGLLKLVKSGYWSLSEEGKNCYWIDAKDVYRKRRELRERRAEEKVRGEAKSYQDQGEGDTSSRLETDNSGGGYSNQSATAAPYDEASSQTEQQIHRQLEQSASQTKLAFLLKLEAEIQHRKTSPLKGSYTASLFAAGTNRIAQKVGEEAVEVVIATLGQGREEQISELADLIVHMLVLMAQQGISIEELCAELERRHKPRSDASFEPRTQNVDQTANRDINRPEVITQLDSSLDELGAELEQHHKLLRKSSSEPRVNRRGPAW